MSGGGCGPCIRGLLAMMLWVAAAAAARGHNPDTSYARVSVERDEVVLRLTYDVTTLVRMAPEVDADGDLRVTPEELGATVPGVVRFLRDHAAVEIDAAAVRLPDPAPVAWPPDAGPAIPQADWHAPTSLVTFAFHLPTPRPATDVWLEFSFFEPLGLAHTVLGSFTQGSDTAELLFTATEPDYLFEASWPAIAPAAGAAVTPPSAAVTAAGPHGRGDAPRRGSQSLAARLRLFFRLGVEHIFLGFDHVLFLVALVLVSDLRSLVRVVTAFTVAHSITLALATLGWLNPPPRLVESAIAATIVFTGLENLRLITRPPEAAAGRWRLTFLFGLVHGFGFAGVLRDLGLPREGFIRSLLAFNLGVEAGQLAIVAALAVPAAVLQRGPRGAVVRTVLSLAIAACGLGWLADRALGLAVMPW